MEPTEIHKRPTLNESESVSQKSSVETEVAMENAFDEMFDTYVSVLHNSAKEAGYGRTNMTRQDVLDLKRADILFYVKGTFMAGGANGFEVTLPKGRYTLDTIFDSFIDEGIQRAEQRRLSTEHATPPVLVRVGRKIGEVATNVFSGPIYPSGEIPAVLAQIELESELSR